MGSASERALESGSLSSNGKKRRGAISLVRDSATASSPNRTTSSATTWKPSISSTCASVLGCLREILLEGERDKNQRSRHSCESRRRRVRAQVPFSSSFSHSLPPKPLRDVAPLETRASAHDSEHQVLSLLLRD